MIILHIIKKNLFINNYHNKSEWEIRILTLSKYIDIKTSKINTNYKS